MAYGHEPRIGSSETQGCCGLQPQQTVPPKIPQVFREMVSKSCMCSLPGFINCDGLGSVKNHITQILSFLDPPSHSIITFESPAPPSGPPLLLVSDMIFERSLIGVTRRVLYDDDHYLCCIDIAPNSSLLGSILT